MDADQANLMVSTDAPAPGIVALSQEQFQQLIEAVRPPTPPPEPELDLANDPNTWSWDKVRALLDTGEMQSVSFVPDETVMIGWNGLYVYVTKDVENVVPECHYQVYRDSRSATRQAYEDARQTLLKRVPSGPAGPMASFTTGWKANG